MNREYKFRAWLKIKKKMVDVTEINFKEKFIKIDESYYSKINFCGIVIPFDQIELMQYTGIKDKNGVEIYDGDIVRFEVDDICTKPFYINYDINDCSFSLFRKGIVDRGLLAHYSKDIAVIGNIYANKGLLENE